MVIEIVMFILILVIVGYFIAGSIIISLLERWERSVMKIDGYNGFEGVFIDKEKGSRECKVKYDSIIGMIIVWPLVILSFIVCLIYKLIRKLCGI